MQKDTLVSIAMTAYNGEKYIEQQIRSIMEQSYRNIEIVIVDDGSTDRSIDIINKLAAIDSRIRLYRNPRNLGVIYNLYKATSLTTGELICCCDQDDVWREDRIEILKELIEKDDDNMMAYSDLEICDENLKTIYPSYFKFIGTKPKEGYLRELSFLKNIVTGAAVMFRKKVKDMSALVSTDVPFIHDHFAFVLSSGLGKVAYTKEKLLKYRQHSESTIGVFSEADISNEMIIKGLLQKIEYFRKAPFSNLEFDLDRLERFCRCLERGSLFERLSFIDCYLFLRKDKLWNKFLALMDCFFPDQYRTLLSFKKKMPRSVIYLWFKRTIFIVWAIIVLTFFAKEFIANKVLQFIGYLHA